MEIELELTYLAKKLPAGLMSCKFKDVVDVYFPKESLHPTLRLRKNGSKLELTKKEPQNDVDSSTMVEQTVPLTQAEYDAFSKLPGKRVAKRRYFYDYNGRRAEIDVFLEELSGLVVVDFEFESEAAMKSFKMPEFCLVDVTQEKFIAGGMLCGKKYLDIELELKKFNYVRINFQIV